MPFSIVAIALSLLVPGFPIAQDSNGPEATLLYSALDNGDFSEEGPTFTDETGLPLLAA